MNASERAIIVALRSCIVRVTISSVTASSASSFAFSASGITPTTVPLASRHAMATSPIRPTLPPPYTNWSPRSASAAPSSRAASLYMSATCRLDEQ